MLLLSTIIQYTYLYRYTYIYIHSFGAALVVRVLMPFLRAEAWALEGHGRTAAEREAPDIPHVQAHRPELSVANTCSATNKFKHRAEKGRCYNEDRNGR